MAVKKCCIENCNSCSTRKEDYGVTYHKFPKDEKLYDAVPSIFSWDISEKDTNMDVDTPIDNTDKDTNNTSTDSKESEGENVDAIKKFIEDQEKEIQEKDEMEKGNIDVVIGDKEEPLAVATSVMDMILSKSEAKIAKNDVKATAKPTLSPGGDKGNSSMALSVGSKVEAKDFGEEWYPAEITEVDYDEMEVLVHYEIDLKKHDEWISVSSPRLRPIGSGPTKTKPLEDITSEPLPAKEEIKETKVEEKSKLAFEVGERCLARWRDNRRFMATINKELENGNFEIIFDDGFHWTCNISRMSKLKEKHQESLTIDTSSKSPTSSTLSPVYGAGPSNATNLCLPPTPAYHTHLFDPTRDYLGSKSERREMKRKLNIKEIFNIGQKRPKILKAKEVKPIVKRPQVKKEIKPKLEIVDPIIEKESKVEIPGSVDKKESVDIDISCIKEEEAKHTEETEQIEENEVIKMEIDSVDEETFKDAADISETFDCKADEDSVQEEEVKLEKFEKQDDVKHEEVIDRIKEVINKLEDGLNKVEREKLNSPKLEIKIEEPIEAEVKVVPDETAAIVCDKDKDPTDNVKVEPEKPKSKIKKGKKLRLLQEKKVKKQVEKVKNELEEMKKQVEEMRQQMLMKTQELATKASKAPLNQEMPESFLLPGEWCAKWLNGQPIGTVSEIECEVKIDGQSKPALPRRSVQVEDKRLPAGWTKHMVRRSFGHSAGKWDVVLVSPDNRRFHTKNEMRNYLENNQIDAEELAPYQHAIMDFGVHLKLSRRMGWISSTPGGVPDAPMSPLPAGTLSSTSPLVKRKKLSLKKKVIKVKQKKRRLAIKLKLPRPLASYAEPEVLPIAEPPLDQPTLEDGYVYVGSLKVQVIDNLLRCPAEGCLKNFRNNTLIQMHIKHYHRELRKMLGATPKVLDLAYARTIPMKTEERRPQNEPKVLKIKIARPKREEPRTEPKEIYPEIHVDVGRTTPVKDIENTPKALDSPKLRHALVNKPVKRPRVLLPVRRPEPEQIPTDFNEDVFEDNEVEVSVEVPMLEPLDFETAISTHTVTKPVFDKKKKGDKKKSFAAISRKAFSEDEEWFGINSDMDTRSSFPRSGTPDSKIMDGKAHLVSSESNEEQKDQPNMYMFTENGERIKIVHMKREEIINCHCGFREEDGLMVQCELCLCWQHALCHNIQKESEVPEKYTCSICLNPRRGRRSKRFVHDQDRVYEGLLPGAAASPSPSPCPCPPHTHTAPAGGGAGCKAADSLRRSHELAGNLIRIDDALHALRVKYYVATKKDHPKLYLWAQDWEASELSYTQEKLNSDYSDLNIMISALGKENLPIKPEDMKDLHLNMTPPSEEQDGDRFSHREGALGSQALLSGLLSSPGGASLDLPISTSELERLAKTVQEREYRCVGAGAGAGPQPEAAIEPGACRERLLRHIARCHATLDARLDSIEAQVAELESQDPSFEDDETADYFPRTKQTIQMLMRDLDTMEELGVIT